ncbi:TA system VapC family ribonuclease toxin [Methylocystis sp.]|uniref:TA system VapC family ribonuclease toxin n=1 Tax=Methylocystis sp. TaxID=1911079 RepID=UPI003DA336B1
MLVDTNILLYAVVEDIPQHSQAKEWLSNALAGDQRIAVPWQTIGSVIRILTQPRLFSPPRTGTEAWEIVRAWLDSPVAWVPPTTERTAAVLGELIVRHRVTGRLVPDAQLAALAIEHGIPIVSADTDFARFPEVRWINPLA